MDIENLLLMKGEWIGLGSMTIGAHSGEIAEYIDLDTTDRDNSLSYIRKSRITFPTRVVLHNEVGYMRTDGMGLLLSTGSYEILDWIEASSRYEQVAGSSDSRNMIREVTFPQDQSMVWENSMEVNHRGSWVSHTTRTEFTLVG